MAVNIGGLIAMLVFYAVIFIVGMLAARKAKKKHGGGGMTENSEEMILAGRNIGAIVGIFTITATWVDGGLLNGSAQQVYSKGLVWCQAPFGYAISLWVGGYFFADRMRNSGYVTMLDPLQECFGDRMCGFLFLPCLLGEIFWSGAVLEALGATVSVIIDLDPSTSVIISTAVAIIYTVTGGLYAVCYTDIVELIFIFVALWLCVPFGITNVHVGALSYPSNDWFGTVQPKLAAQYIDSALLLILGGLPWQDYFQRVLSSKCAFRAKLLSYIGGFGTMFMAIPPIIIGVVGKATRWNETGYDGPIPMDEQHSSLLLPLVLTYLTPTYISYVGLGAVAAAVMSSSDSSLLSAGSLFAKNVYKPIIRKTASERELVWVIRLTVVIVGIFSAATAIAVSSVYSLWFLCSDLIYVVMFPQLIGAVFLKNHSNTYGSVAGYVVGLVLRVLGGEPALHIPVVIRYPFYDETEGQLFPFKTLSMVVSFVFLIGGSAQTKYLFERGYLSQKFDIFNCFSKMYEFEFRSELSTYPSRAKMAANSSEVTWWDNKAFEESVDEVHENR